MIPVGAVYIHTVYDFNFLIYGATGLMLIQNIDNFFAELLKLQIEKNHKQILKQKSFLHFEVCQQNSDIAYWWVMFLTLLNLFNSFLRSSINRVMICPNLTEFKAAQDSDSQYYSSNGMKVVYFLNIFLILVEIAFILFPFLSIPVVSLIMSKFNDYHHDHGDQNVEKL